MKELTPHLIDRIFQEINSNKHKILKVKEIVKSLKQDKPCRVHLFDGIFLETDKKDYNKTIKRNFKLLLENEEYELCSELKKLKLI